MHDAKHVDHAVVCYFQLLQIFVEIETFDALVLVQRWKSDTGQTAVDDYHSLDEVREERGTGQGDVAS